MHPNLFQHSYSAKNEVWSTWMQPEEFFRNEITSSWFVLCKRWFLWRGISQVTVRNHLRLRKHLSLSSNVFVIFLQSKEASNTCHLTSLLLLKVSFNTHIETNTVFVFVGSESFYGNAITLFIWNVKVSIYQHFGCVGSKMSSLQQLCSLLPFNPWHWHNLGQTCLQLLQSNRATGRMNLTLCQQHVDLLYGFLS